MGSCRLEFRPVLAISAPASSHERKIEEGEVVHQLINRTSVRPAERSVFPNKAASVEIVKTLRHLAAFGNSRHRRKHIPRHADFLGRKCRHQPNVRLWTLEKRCIEFPEFVLELVAFRKEHLVDVLCDAFAALKEVPVVGNAAENHVQLRQLATREFKPTIFRIRLAFRKRERPQRNPIRDAVVQTFLVIDDLAQYP